MKEDRLIQKLLADIPYEEPIVILTATGCDAIHPNNEYAALELGS